MRTKILRIVPVTVLPLGDFRSLPAQIGTAAPLNPVKPARHLEYPQEMSLSLPDLAIPPREPTNDSPIALDGNLTETDNAEAIDMTPPESQMPKSIHGVAVPSSLAQEIEQALEMMRRVRTAQLARGKGEAVELPGNKYELPKPLVYPVSRSSDRK